MKYLTLCLLSCVFSCRESEKVILQQHEAKASTAKKAKPDYLMDTLAIDGKTYTILQGYPGYNNLPLRILYGRDTIYRHDDYSGNGFELKDLEGNGVLDVELNYISNIGGVKEWVVFDAKSGTFRNIKDFVAFPSSEKLAGTKYFYSDHRMGCAGGMWGSELFFIENFEAKAIARIFIVRCPDADYTHGVTIYKIGGKSEQIVEQMPEVPEKYQNDSDSLNSTGQKTLRNLNKTCL